MTMLAENYAQVEQAIDSACRGAGRRRRDITLIAVSKVHPASMAEEAIGLGMVHLGENKVQEWAGKKLELSECARERVDAHLIGHLQSNKAAKAVEIFDAVDTLDSLKLAQRLSAAAAAMGRVMPVLIEIKLSGEGSKEGLAPESAELERLLEQLPALPGLRLRGVMTVPPFLEDLEAVRPYFSRLRAVREDLARRHAGLSFESLSMGMTHDFRVAIEEGATEIRVGTALFGRRMTGVKP